LIQETFFNELDIKDFKPEKKKKELTCDDCGLYKTCNSPYMKASGKGKKKALIIGEAPGKVEDDENTQFVGKSGQFLRQSIKDIGFFLDRDFIKINVVNCRPPNNRDPRTREINACRKNVYAAIEKYKPHIIIPMGKYALQSLLGHRITGRIEKVSFSNWVGETIPDQELKAWICPMYHPAYIMRNEDDSVLLRLWYQHLEKAMSLINIPVYIHNYQSDVFVLTDVDEVCDLLNDFLNNKKSPLAFDYETTGKKPHRNGHRIISVSISDGMFAWSFPFFYENKRFMELWRQFLNHPDIVKIAHNEYFERLWSQTIAGCDVNGEMYDTAMIQHILKNNKNKQLKFWSYINFGILGYDDDLHDFITKVKDAEDEKSANAFNRLDEAEIEKVLKYGGLDSLLTFKLYENQKNQLTDNYTKAYALFIDGNKYLLQCQQNGIRLNVGLMKETRGKIRRKLDLLHKQIMDSDEVKKWDGENIFDYSPNKKDVSHLLFDILELKPVSYTKKIQKPSTDKNALEKMNIPLTKKILEHRRWEKTSNIITQFERENINGFIHPFFHLVTVTTYRSSSSNPNFQNIPNRDEEIKKLIRSMLIPRQGNRLISYDFKQMEVCVAACYNHDPNLIEYVNDVSKDMHRDMAAMIFMKDKKDITKKERYLGKNGFVFPEFYGDYFGKISPIIWENMPVDTKKHLKSCGIKNLYDFIEHVKDIEEYFWYDLFPVYSEYKIKTYEEYQKKGHVDFYTGFRCYGPMERNKVINYRIQGTAFHILLWTLIHVMKRMEDEKSFVIGQIHDAIEADVNPEYEDRLDYLVWLYATQKVKQHWDWINVPLRVEKERSEVNGNWAEMEDCGFLNFSKE
jgi:DNA polymerase